MQNRTYEQNQTGGYQGQSRGGGYQGQNYNPAYHNNNGYRHDPNRYAEQNNKYAEQNGKQISKKDVSATTAFLIAVKKEWLDRDYSEMAELIGELYKTKEALIMRYLCNMRYILMRNYVKVDNMLLYEMKNIDTIDIFPYEDLNQLLEWGIDVMQYNARSSKYMLRFNHLINENVDNCKKLYPEWITWEFIRELFMFPRHVKDEGTIRGQYEKYKQNFAFYPYSMYINWKPVDCRNLLETDRKFLTIIYKQHGKQPPEHQKVHDAAEETKTNIYSFIRNSNSINLVVDCENSDPYKIYAVLKNLNQDEIKKIKKIMLFDDAHTTNAWSLLENFVDITTEYVIVDRVNEHKSLVDIKVTAGICAEYYKNNVDSFLLASSDSDYWGVISSLPEACFLVLIEYGKCGQSIKDALTTRNIYYCAIDDFYAGNIENFKTNTLLSEMAAALANQLDINGYALTEYLYKQTRINANEGEMKAFFDRYVKTLSLQMDTDGNFSFKIKGLD